MSRKKIAKYEKHILDDPYEYGKKLLPESLRFFNNPSVSSIEIKNMFINLNTNEQQIIEYYYLQNYGCMDRYKKILGIYDCNQTKHNEDIKSINNIVNEYLNNITSEYKVYLPKNITLLELFSIYENYTPISIDLHNTLVVYEMFSHFITLGQEYTVYVIRRGIINQKKLGDSIKHVTTLTKFLNNDSLTKELNKLKAYAISDSALLKSYEHKIEKSIYFYMKVFIAHQEKIDIDNMRDVKLNKKNIISIAKSFSKNIRLIKP